MALPTTALYKYQHSTDRLSFRTASTAFLSSTANSKIKTMDPATFYPLSPALGAASFYPLSPALSAADSLDGLSDRDLDAFLAAKGSLSQWPTPPLHAKNDFYIRELELSCSDSGDESDLGELQSLDGEMQSSDGDQSDLGELQGSDGESRAAELQSLDGESEIGQLQSSNEESEISQLQCSDEESDPGEFQSSDSGDSQNGTCRGFPSPAMSDVDSLDGLSDHDLDAFLAMKGSLSHWPTPPLNAKDEVLIREMELLSLENGDKDDDAVELQSLPGDDESEDDIDHLDVATVFARELSSSNTPQWDDVLSIESLLVRAGLPTEVMALAFNILSKLHNPPLPTEAFDPPPLTLLITSTLSLASIYTNDHPPSLSFWASHVAQGSLTPPSIERAKLSILWHLQWQTHSLHSPAMIASALHLFERRTLDHALPPPLPRFRDRHPRQPPTLRLEDASSASWANGQLTPEATPPVSALEFSGLSLL